MVFGWGKKKQEDTSVEEIPQNKDISLTDIPKIISDLTDLRKSQTLSEINNLRNKTAPLIEELMKIGNVLEKDDLNMDDVDKHLAIIVVRGKKQVIDMIKKDVVLLPKISSFEDAEKLNSVLNLILKKVGDVLGRQTRIIHIFAKKYATQLKENLAVMNSNHSEISDLLKNYHSTKSLSEETFDAINQIENLTELRKKQLQKINDVTKSTITINERMSVIQNRINEIKSSDDYKKYQNLKNTLDEFVNEKLKIKNQVNAQFTKISRPLSRYEYASSLDKNQKNILSNLVSEPFDVLTTANKDSVIVILENMRKGVLSGSISVKDVEKTSSQITETEEYLDRFVHRVSEYHKRYREIQNNLNSLMPKELISLESDLVKNSSMLDESQLKSETFQDEVNEIDSKIPKLISEIEQKLRRFSNTRYNILRS